MTEAKGIGRQIRLSAVVFLTHFFASFGVYVLAREYVSPGAGASAIAAVYCVLLGCVRPLWPARISPLRALMMLALIMVAVAMGLELEDPE